MDLRFEPLGDQAVMIYAPDEKKAYTVAEHLRQHAPAWTHDIVQAYASVAVFYDLLSVDFEAAASALRDLVRSAPGPSAKRTSKRHIIPCCYELDLDLKRIARHTGLPRDEIIRVHEQTAYTVYAIGFCPGFPYLGYLDSAIASVPRLESPRLAVEAGSVGLTGRQTGIYTLKRPGGWNIVGRTPLELVNVEDGYFPLRTGDEVKFERIDDKGFQELRGERLPAEL